MPSNQFLEVYHYCLCHSAHDCHHMHRYLRLLGLENQTKIYFSCGKKEKSSHKLVRLN